MNTESQGTAPKGAGGGFTPGPWDVKTRAEWEQGFDFFDGPDDAYTFMADVSPEDARLIAAAPTQHAEMARFLPVIERAEADPKLWARLTEGTGIATANAYRAALAKAGGES